MYVNVLCLWNLNRKSMFSFHQTNKAKSSKNLILRFFCLVKTIRKVKISLDLIKPWQTLGIVALSHDSI